MTKNIANKLLNEAASLIFQVEEKLSDDSYDLIRREGYKARIQIGILQNRLPECNPDNIKQRIT